MLIQVNDTCAFGGVTFGETDSFGVELYFLALDGWGAPQSTIQVTQKAAGDGGFPSPAFLQPKHFTATVAVVADTRAEMVAAIDRATAAAPMKVAQPVTIVNGGTVRYAVAQREGEITQKETSDVSTELTVQFVAADPRKFGETLTASTGLASASGGLTIPFTVPFSIDSTVVTGQCSLTNSGKTEGSVTLRIDGPIDGPIVTHSSGAILAFASSYSLIAGNWITVNMDARTVLENDQADRSTFVVSRGFDGFDEGENTWTFSGSSYSPDARLTVTATPAWL